MQGGLIDLFDVDQKWLNELCEAVQKYELGNDPSEVANELKKVAKMVKAWFCLKKYICCFL